MLFANDLAYTPDLKASTFVFDEPRPVSFRFVIPPWVRKAEDLFRVDADGIHEVKWKADGDAVVIEDQRSRDAIYVATRSNMVRIEVERRRQTALVREQANGVEQQDLEKLNP